MVVKFENFEFSFKLKGRPVFKPNARGVEIGYDIKERVEAMVAFDPFFYHFRDGGHVAALHQHRRHAFFARVDIEHFFYGIGRNRVAQALGNAGVARPGFYARWSTVRNPYEDPRYALPYGFVQSPILATLVLMQSVAGTFLRHLPADLTASVYMDDICLSAPSHAQLAAAFTGLWTALSDANFAINPAKVRHPSAAMDVFNCDIEHQRSAVRASRRNEFYKEPRSSLSVDGFEFYCASVEQGNVS